MSQGELGYARTHGYGRAILRLVFLGSVVLVAANLVFTMVRLADGLVPRDRAEATLRAAFDRGTLTPRAYPQEQMTGLDQATDCATLQAMVLGNIGKARNALAPRLATRETTGEEYGAPFRCRELDLMLSTVGPRSGPPFWRFWHGQSSVAALMLTVLPLDGYRALLTTLTLGLIGLVAVAAAMTSRSVLLALAGLLVVSFFLSGQLGFGQLVAFGPAHVALWSMALLLVLTRRRVGPRGLVLLAVLGGCLDGFLDPMVVAPLALSVFLVAAAAVSLPRWRAHTPLDAVVEAVVFAVAWCFGLMGTFAIKLLLTTAMFGPQAVLWPGVSAVRSGVAAALMGLPMLPETLLRLGMELWAVGYVSQGSRPVATFVALLGLAGWAIALWRLFASVPNGRAPAVLVSGLGYFMACAVALAWFAAFPGQVDRDAWYMVRVAMIGVASGWGWALTDYAATRVPSRMRR